MVFLIKNFFGKRMQSTNKTFFYMSFHIGSEAAKRSRTRSNGALGKVSTLGQNCYTWPAFAPLARSKTGQKIILTVFSKIAPKE